MINVRNLSSRVSDTNQTLKWAEESYRGADNAPGDSDSRKDRVSLSDGKTRTQVVLSKDLFNRSYVEKVVGADGVESITAVTTPTWLNFFGQSSAYVVERNGAGSYSGLEHEYNPNGSYPFYSDSRIDSATAQRRFAMLDSQFIHDSKA